MSLRTLAIGFVALVGTTVTANAQVSLVLSGPTAAQPGQPVSYTLSLVNSGAVPAAGYQAFLSYDPTKLSFTGGSYDPTLFALALITPITASGGDIDLAAGVDIANGQLPTLASGIVATLNFLVIDEDCGFTPIAFRTNTPPSAVTNSLAQPILPLTLTDAALLTADGTDPTITCPGTQVVTPGVGCQGIVPDLSGLVTASDNCDTNLTITQVPLAGSTFTATTIVTVTATDDAGNFATCMTTVNVSSSAAPTLELAVTSSTSCVGIGDPVTVTLSMSGLCPFEAAGFQAFLQFDPSKLTFVSGSYTAVPFGLPVITPITATLSGEINVASGIDQIFGQLPTTADALLVTLNFIAASDDCTTAVTFRPHTPPSRITQLGGAEIPGLVLINSPAIQIDSTGPVISCPTNVTVQCIGDVPTPATTITAFLAQGGSASDNCTPTALLTVIHLSDTPAGSCPTIITRSYRVEDACGNASTCRQIITVNDTINPSIACPPNVNVACFGSVPAPAANLAQFIGQGGSASDNCGTVAVTHIGDTDNGGSGCPSNPRIITRSYRATDACGNIADCSHTITISDNVDPLIACPADVNVQCVSLIPVPDVGSVSASDNCGGVVVTHISDVGNGGTGCSASPLIITRTYRATDTCGNFADCSHLITVVDTTAPVVTCPADVNVQCVGNIPLPNVGAVSASDNCSGSVTIAYVGDVNNGGSGCTASPLIISRTYSATDACGNVGFCTQTITVIDTTAPIITLCPPAITVNADAGGCTAVVNPGLPTAIDNCFGALTITATRSDSQPLAAPFPTGTTVITWNVADACGNANTCLQNVTVNPINIMVVNVQLSATMVASVQRCIRFEFYTCPSATPVVVDQVITFSSGLATGVLVSVPCGNYTCVTARDRLHTLRRTALGFGIVGPQYVANFTGTAELTNGNLNDDAFIDILDFGVFAGQFAVNYGSGNTNCATANPHADINGNGIVFTEDFTFIQINFLKFRDPNCCGLPTILGQPVTRISLADLFAQGLGNLAVADLTGDGWLDEDDMLAFMAGVRPKARAIFVGADGARWFDASNWSGGQVPTADMDVQLPAGVVIDQPGAVARNVLAAGSLAVLNGSLTASQLTVQSGGALTVAGEASLLDLTSLTLEADVPLIFDGGIIQLTGGIFEKADPDLIIGDTPALSVLRLRDGATADITGNTIIGNHPGDRGRIDILDPATRLTTTDAFFIGFEGEGRLIVRSGLALATDLFIGFAVTAQGDAEIHGNGATGTIAVQLEVGGDGVANLLVDQGAFISAADISIGASGNITGSGRIIGPVTTPHQPQSPLLPVGLPPTSEAPPQRPAGN